MTTPAWIADELYRRASEALYGYFCLPPEAQALITPGQYVDRYMAALPAPTWTEGTEERGGRK